MLHAPCLICLMGPTGSGKTAASLHLARALLARGQNVVVINADSRQTYTDFPIITAQPTVAERATCPHWLYGYLPSTEKNSAGIWASAAQQAIVKAFAEGCQPLLVGGTGLYFRALLDGMVDIPQPDPAISARLIAQCEIQGAPALYARLNTIDPAYAARIHPHDKQRVLRALEVWESTGKTFSQWHKETPSRSFLDNFLSQTCLEQGSMQEQIKEQGATLPVLRLGVGLPLPELSPFLAARIQAMLKAGAMDEARAALVHCPDTTAPAWTGIGCAEAASFLQGETSFEQCVELWTKHTRAYAKRQWTWFRADKRILWHRPGEEETLTGLALDFLQQA